jgi:hypothetical protein
MKNLNNVEINSVCGGSIQEVYEQMIDDGVPMCEVCTIVCTPPGSQTPVEIELKDCLFATINQAKKTIEQKGGVCGEKLFAGWRPCADVGTNG